MPRKFLILTALTGVLAAAPLTGAFAKDTEGDIKNFFDISDEVEEAGDVVEKGANKTVSFFDGLFDDDDKDDDLKFHAPWEKKN